MIFSLLIRQRKIRNVRSFDTKEIIKYSSNFLGPESYTRRTSEWLIKLIIQHNHVLFFGRVPHLMWWCLMLKIKSSLVKMDLVKHVHQSWWEKAWPLSYNMPLKVIWCCQFCQGQCFKSKFHSFHRCLHMTLHRDCNES